MNDHQLHCFLALSRTLNFSRAAQELFITQPALSYQIRSLEKELGVTLFQRSTTHVELTPAGLAFLDPAHQMYRQYLVARNALQPFLRPRQLVLRLPAVMTLRDPIYPPLLQQLHEACPDTEITVSTALPDQQIHHLLSTGTDALVFLAADPPQAEVEQEVLFQNQCFLAAGPAHPFHAQEKVELRDLRGHTLFYEPSEQPYVECLRAQAETLGLPLLWSKVESFAHCYSSLLAGRGLFVSPMRYEIFPQEWYLPLALRWPLPATCLMTLRSDHRPQMEALRRIFREAYRSRR